MSIIKQFLVHLEKSRDRALSHELHHTTARITILEEFHFSKNYTTTRVTLLHNYVTARIILLQELHYCKNYITVKITYNKNYIPVKIALLLELHYCKNYTTARITYMQELHNCGKKVWDLIYCAEMFWNYSKMCIKDNIQLVRHISWKRY